MRQSLRPKSRPASGAATCRGTPGPLGDKSPPTSRMTAGVWAPGLPLRPTLQLSELGRLLISCLAQICFSSETPTPPGPGSLPHPGPGSPSTSRILLPWGLPPSPRRGLPPRDEVSFPGPRFLSHPGRGLPRQAVGPPLAEARVSPGAEGEPLSASSDHRQASRPHRKILTCPEATLGAQQHEPQDRDLTSRHVPPSLRPGATASCSTIRTRQSPGARTQAALRGGARAR